MKTRVTVYSFREFDEKRWFDQFSKELDIELVTCPEPPTIENANIAVGSHCINIVTSELSRELIEKFYSYGVGYITTRTIGYDHIDIAAAKEFGIKVANAPYGPNGVADYTLMLMLMSIRKMKSIMRRNVVQDYTLKGIQGIEIKDLTVGVIGTGRIGMTVIKNLSGFGCRILAYDVFEKEEVKQYATYVQKDDIWKESDIITLHTPLTDDSYHMINENTISQMKPGVVMINTARGGLIDSKAFIDGIESGKIGAAGLDVVEDEFSLYYFDRKSEVIVNRELALLKSYPNVIVSHHMAFYTDNYGKTVIGDSLKGCRLFVDGKANPWEVT